MLRFQQRSRTNPEPLGDLPPLMAELLRARGIETEEEAQRFLHPDLGMLHDPLRMSGMETAVGIIRDAVSQGRKIAVYGDYDCDGVCASVILLETLEEMGADCVSYLPERHREGYGLNQEAVRTLHAGGVELLITVDCGITNLREVELARQLGMTVIVTDHHQPGEEIPAADAVLNPLLGNYPFRRLCGAGVALKITQALLGMEAAESKLEVAALATVADIVPLVDENRVIVAEGLKRMASTERPGLRALMDAAGAKEQVDSGVLGFRLAPRINAGGRLENAAQCVRLLKTREQAEAKAIAGHLEELNRQRQALQTEITRLAEMEILRGTDFRDDRVLLAMGDSWESGVVGLAAGKLCEKYHWPVIVLSRNPDTGMAVGSCRSIPGVNIFRMLSACEKRYREEHGEALFDRFGGHEQAAGLTIRADRLQELRRLLNAAVDEACDLKCYLPVAEYDAEMPLDAVSLALVDTLAGFEPTGCGNPAPVFLGRQCQVLQARPVGNGAHLKLSLTDGAVRQDGIAFGLGEMGRLPLDRVDVTFVPGRNVYNGRVSVQMQVQQLTPSVGSLPIPETETLRTALLQEIALLAENINQLSPNADSPATLRVAQLRQLMETGLGILLIAHGEERAREAAALGEGADFPGIGDRADLRGFTTVLFSPKPEQLTDQWRHVVLLDGDILPGEAAVIRQRCPRAELRALPAFEPCREMIRTAAELTEDQLREIYRCVRGRLDGRRDASLRVLREALGFTEWQLLAALTAMDGAGILRFSPEPWRIETIPGARGNPRKTALWRWLETI